MEDVYMINKFIKNPRPVTKIGFLKYKWIVIQWCVKLIFQWKPWVQDMSIIDFEILL